MEENFNQQNENKDKQITFSLSSNMLSFICSLLALALIVLTKIIANFLANPGVFPAIMAIFAYLLASAGVCFSFLFNVVKNKRVTADFWFTVVVLAMALMFF